MKYTNNKNNISEILKVYIINSITISYILNIKIRPLVTEYAIPINLLDLILMHTSVSNCLIRVTMSNDAEGFGWKGLPS
jgi:uncharacterized membrane protein YvlD (DUF360 family)